MPANPFDPTAAGHGSELTPEEWASIIITPLEAASSVMSIHGVETITTSHPTHLPLMTEVALDDTVWVGPNDAVVEVEPNTDELVLMGRGIKSLKVICKLSGETVRSSPDGLAASQRTLINQLTKKVDAALLNGNVTAGIGGLVAAAGTTIPHDDATANLVYDEMVDALATAESAYAEPTCWLMHPRTIAVLRKMRSTQGTPLLQPNLAEAGGDAVLGRVVLPAPQLPLGTILAIDPRTIHCAIDQDGMARLLDQTFAQNDQLGVLIISRFDIGSSNPAGLVAITGVLA